MTEVIGGVLMALGGGMLSASSIRMLAGPRPSVSAGVHASLQHTPAPTDAPADMLALLDQLSTL